MRATLLGLAAMVLGACGGDPLQYDDAVAGGDGAIEVAPDATPDPPPPAPVACVIAGLNFFEFSCPGHPGCNRCRAEEIAGTGYLMNCLAPSGALCIDFCEYCPDAAPRS